MRKIAGDFDRRKVIKRFEMGITERSSERSPTR
jgi:hypothetical protein